jgi:hypothetical protein
LGHPQNLTHSSLPTIADDVTIDGTGQNITVGGTISDSALIVRGGNTLNLFALTISNTCSPCSGGGIKNESSTVNITECTFSGISASGDGGAIFNLAATLNVTRSTFSGNAARGSSGGAILNPSRRTRPAPPLRSRPLRSARPRQQR